MATLCKGEAEVSIEYIPIDDTPLIAILPLFSVSAFEPTIPNAFIPSIVMVPVLSLVPTAPFPT